MRLICWQQGVDHLCCLTIFSLHSSLAFPFSFPFTYCPSHGLSLLHRTTCSVSLFPSELSPSRSSTPGGLTRCAHLVWCCLFASSLFPCSLWSGLLLVSLRGVQQFCLLHSEVDGLVTWQVKTNSQCVPLMYISVKVDNGIHHASVEIKGQIGPHLPYLLSSHVVSALGLDPPLLDSTQVHEFTHKCNTGINPASAAWYLSMLVEWHGQFGLYVYHSSSRTIMCISTVLHSEGCSGH